MVFALARIIRVECPHTRNGSTFSRSQNEKFSALIEMTDLLGLPVGACESLDLSVAPLTWVHYIVSALRTEMLFLRKLGLSTLAFWRLQLSQAPTLLICL